MEFSILLLPILAGAIYCRTSYHFRYRFYRRSGYELFFTAATAGAFLLGLAYFVVTVITSVPYLSLIYCLWDWVSPPIPWLGTCALTVVIAPLCARLADRIDERAAQYQRGWILKGIRNRLPFRDGDRVWPFYTEDEVRYSETSEFGNELELLAFEAVEKLDSVVQSSADDPHDSQPRVAPKYMVTLESGKVFVGIISSAPDPIGSFSYMKMIKLASGYRTQSHNVEIVTRYDKYFPDNAGDSDDDESRSRKVELRPADFEVTVSVGRIAHITPFDQTVDGPEDWPMT